MNETAYLDDVPEDYYDPTVEAWVAMQQMEDMRLHHKHHSRKHYHKHPKALISYLGMNPIPEHNMNFGHSFAQSRLFNQWNNKPWKEYLGEPAGYQWDQSSVNKVYKVADSHSYLEPYE